MQLIGFFNKTYETFPCGKHRINVYPAIVLTDMPIPKLNKIQWEIFEQTLSRYGLEVQRQTTGNLRLQVSARLVWNIGINHATPGFGGLFSFIENKLKEAYQKANHI